ncbi:hypothetical protein R1sor_017372 [Riccia sorocarpa]|uniref:Endonuclease/exonuclease/phosphatase domain-containing protein n=1 Tax=Riccia sorocarpa TaxID=122646 RepID=A0ABD3IAE7_9MARC
MSLITPLTLRSRIRDSVGPSPRIKGREERVWRNLVFGRDFTDCFFAAATKTGPRFTHQARCGRRLDRSRLDRIYISDSANWLHEILTLKHLGSYISGDHIPISASIQIRQAGPGEKEVNHSYFKLNAFMLKRPGFKEACKRASEDHSPECTDPRKRWSLGWSRIKRLCQEQIKEEREFNEADRIRKEVCRRRTRMARDCQEEEIVSLTNLEDELNRLEDHEDATWVQRSRSKWLSEGEAPTAYFFSLAKSRYSSDRISCLMKEDGEAVTQTEV